MKKSLDLSLLVVSLIVSPILNAQPESLDTFYDFENVTAEGSDFTIGESPFTVRVIGYTLQDVENPSLANSGNRALVLDPSAPEHKFYLKEASICFSFTPSTPWAVVESNSGIKILYFWLMKVSSTVCRPHTVCKASSPLVVIFRI